jgi:tRNA uridine 5-carboxymethylaminomethyl modification enzyme
LGLVDDERWEHFSIKKEGIGRELSRLKASWIQPTSAKAEEINKLLEKPMVREYSLADLLARPEVTYETLTQAIADVSAELPASPELARQITEQVEIQLKYRGYIDRQEEDIKKLKRQEDTPLPEDFDYQQMQGLSNELKQKLQKVRPENISRATRIPGMTPAAISLLLIYLKKYQAVRAKSA